MVDDTRVRHAIHHTIRPHSHGDHHLPTLLSRVFAPAEECQDPGEIDASHDGRKYDGVNSQASPAWGHFDATWQVQIEATAGRPLRHAFFYRNGRVAISRANARPRPKSSES